LGVFILLLACGLLHESMICTWQKRPKVNAT
jgi:hypothetical protein